MNISKFFHVILILFVSISVSMAQRGGNRTSDPEEIAQWQSERMFRNISSLTEEQKEKIHTINLEFVKKRIEIRNNLRGNRVMMRETMLKQRDKKQKQLKKVLSEEQYQQLTQLMNNNSIRGRRGAGPGRNNF